MENLPTDTAHNLFSFQLGARTLLTLSICRDGKLEVRSTGNRDAFLCANSRLSKSRWTHVTLIHHPHRVSNPTIRNDFLFLLFVNSDCRFIKGYSLMVF